MMMKITFCQRKILGEKGEICVGDGIDPHLKAMPKPKHIFWREGKGPRMIVLKWYCYCLLYFSFSPYYQGRIDFNIVNTKCISWDIPNDGLMMRAWPYTALSWDVLGWTSLLLAVYGYNVIVIVVSLCLCPCCEVSEVWSHIWSCAWKKSITYTKFSSTILIVISSFGIVEGVKIPYQDWCQNA